MDPKIVFADVLDGKKGVLDYENVQFPESPLLVIFPKGLTHGLS